MIKKIIFIFMIAFQAVAFNNVRVIQFFDINDVALKRAQDNNYNYIVVPFQFRASDDIVGNGDVYDNLKIDVCNATIKLSNYNLRIIPLIPMSSKWAMYWKVLQIFENPKIGMNTIYSNDNLPNPLNYYGVYTALNTIRGGGEYNDNGSICDMKNPENYANMGCNSWAEEKEGVDKSVIDLFKAVKQGFKAANVNYELEYIHLQHDEPQFLNWNLMGGVAYPCGNAYPYKGNFVRGEVSSADTLYIDSLLKKGISIEKSYQSLLSNEIYRRVIQAESVFKNIKVMLFSESFDNQSWGGVEWYVKNGRKSSKIYMCGVIDLPGLNDLEKKKVKDKIVLALWNYDGKVVYNGGVLSYLNRNSYNTDYSFKRLSDKGFNFLYIGALQNGDDSKNQIKKFASSAEKYRKNCIGYYAVAWDVNYPDYKWDIIEYMPSVQNKEYYSSSSINNMKFIDNYISFNLRQDNYIKIEIFDIKGRSIKKVCNAVLNEGYHNFYIDKSSAMYILKVIDSNGIDIKSILLVK